MLNSSCSMQAACLIGLLFQKFYWCCGLTVLLMLQATWKKLVTGEGIDCSKPLPPMPSRLVTDDDLKEFCEAMKLFDVPKAVVASNVGVKRKGEHLGGLDTKQYGRGKRAREVC